MSHVKDMSFSPLAGNFSATVVPVTENLIATSINGVKTMLKKTFAAVITTAALLSAGAAMAQPVDPNWAFSRNWSKFSRTRMATP